LRRRHCRESSHDARADLVETYRRLAGLIDVVTRSAFTLLTSIGLTGVLTVGLTGCLTGVLTVGLTGCGTTPHPAASTAPVAIPAPSPSPPPPQPIPDPDLHHPPPRRVLDIDWAKISLTSDADALALWRRIAPTGADWDDKLEEVPAALARPLAIAVLRGGDFTCAKPPPGGDCARPRYDIDPPAEAAGFDAPCLRRLLALWAIAQLDDADAPAVKPALLAIAQLAPPESQLVAAAIHAIPEADHDARLAILANAWRAGQHEVVDSAIGELDDAHLVEAARLHIAGALEVLSAVDHRAVYLAAVTDEALATRARTQAIGELLAQDDKLAADLRAALVVAARSKDCQVAAVAARALDQHGDHRFVPRWPRTASTAALMRSLCVLASYEALQQADEPSLLASYLPARGLERVTITYDPLSDTDSDGDGDPHTTHTAELIARGDAVLPELEDLVRAMPHCTGTICVSDDHEFRFVMKPIGGELVLSRIELADRPPCPEPQPAKP
jgi:hypothetical protein